MRQKSNLFKLILHGFAFRFKADISSNYLKEVRHRIIGVGKNSIDTMIPDKALNFCIKAVKRLHLKVKMSPEETYAQFKDLFKDLDFPDTADLIDEIGHTASQFKFAHYYDNTPFVKDFIDAIHELAKCDIEFGYSSPQRTFGLNFQTEGIKELFDQVMLGFS